MATSSVEFMRHSSVQIRGGAPDYQNYLCSCNNVGLTVVFLLQNRTPVAAWIRGEGKAGRLRDRFADIWHVLAVIYVAAIFGIFVLGIEGGVQYLARATAVTA